MSCLVGLTALGVDTTGVGFAGVLLGFGVELMTELHSCRQTTAVNGTQLSPVFRINIIISHKTVT